MNYIMKCTISWDKDLEIYNDALEMWGRQKEIYDDQVNLLRLI